MSLYTPESWHRALQRDPDNPPVQLEFAEPGMVFVTVPGDMAPYPLSAAEAESLDLIEAFLRDEDHDL